MIPNLLLIFAIALCLLSWFYWFIALACLRRVLRSRQDGAMEFAPMVSVLKPIKGLDNGALENLASFCRQDYPRFELLFGVADQNDPAVEKVEQLRWLFPALDIGLVIAKPLGANPKAATLNALVGEARAEVLVISDSDIRVTPDYLKRVVAPLADPKIGVVTCLYRGQSPANLPARLESLHMDASFAPSAALAWHLGNPVGLGATLAMRKRDLQAAGGYAAIADHLLDDNEIASRIRALGLRIHLSDYPVACLMGAIRFPQQWSREVRWSRGIRVAYPLRYLGIAITFSLPIAIGTACLAGAWPWAWTVIPVALLVRWWVGWRCAMLMGQRQRDNLLWLPLRDLLTAAVWAAAWFGRTVEWRGEEFLLGTDGKLMPKPCARPGGPLAMAIRRLDAHLRKKQGIFEFTSDPRCMFRVSIDPASETLLLSDGTQVRQGDPVCVIHLWNEQLPMTPRSGVDLRWGVTLHRRLAWSVAALAEAADRDPRLRTARAFGGTAAFVSRQGDSQVARFASRFGFEFIPSLRKPSFRQRLHHLGQNVLVLGLQWAFNPGGLRGKPFMRPRERLWMSRQELLARSKPDEPALDNGRLRDGDARQGALAPAGGEGGSD
ncbi:MAG TPA: bacteriohopanetetrol glucosamine biosynthesis glycosyltransferase HpnI [Tepidisphaeraceae bacterium]|nr:bacteriohopanetetrol glucosamine biosynthesis glycosyltransferase HpnI [Tepidisphaeraceae bacterium]